MDIHQINRFPEEIISKIYSIYFFKFVLNSQEFKDKVFRSMLNNMSFKQRKHMSSYYNFKI